jgi:hypothetical protein
VKCYVRMKARMAYCPVNRFMSGGVLDSIHNSVKESNNFGFLFLNMGLEF